MSEPEWVTDPDFLKTMLECKFYQVGDEIRQGNTCGNHSIHGKVGVISRIIKAPTMDKNLGRPFRYDVCFDDSGDIECTGAHFVAWRRPKK